MREKEYKPAMELPTCEHGLDLEDKCDDCFNKVITQEAFEELLNEGQQKRLRGRTLRRFVMNRLDKRATKIRREIL